MPYIPDEAIERRKAALLAQITPYLTKAATPAKRKRRVSGQRLADAIVSAIVTGIATAMRPLQDRLAALEQRATKADRPDAPVFDIDATQPDSVRRFVEALRRDGLSEQTIEQARAWVSDVRPAALVPAVPDPPSAAIH